MKPVYAIPIPKAAAEQLSSSGNSAWRARLNKPSSARPGHHQKAVRVPESVWPHFPSLSKASGWPLCGIGKGFRKGLYVLVSIA